MSDNKFYWLKLKKDFFKRHDIVFIRSLPQGEEIVLFYLQLMLESVDHDGELRFSEDIPYSTPMLASITSNKPELVEMAMNILSELKMVEITEDQTIRLPKVQKMIGSASDTDAARRMRRLREQRANNLFEQTEQERTKDYESKSKSKSKSIDIERNTKERKFVPPTLEEVTSYCQERNSPVNPKEFFDYYSIGDWKDSQGNKVKNWKQKLITWEKHRTEARVEQPSRPKYGMTQEDIDSVMEKFRRNGQ